MVTWSDFNLVAAQAVIWTPHDLSFNSSKILATLLPKFKDKYNGEMNVFPPMPPLQQALPINVPQIMLKSGDGCWQLSMSPVRVDSTWNSSPGLEGGRIEYVHECAKALKEYIGSFEARVIRMALVTSRLCLIDDPATELIGRFCNQKSQDGPFVRSRAFEIHNFKAYKPTRTEIGCSLNSWVRCKAVDIVNKGKAIVFENDLNTPENESLVFSPEQIERFFGAAPLETNDILHKYFG